MAIWTTSTQCSIYAHTTDQNSIGAWVENGDVHVETYDGSPAKRGYRQSEAVGRITASLLRHLLTIADGPQCDELSVSIYATNAKVKEACDRSRMMDDEAYETEQPQGSYWVEVRKLFYRLSRRGKIEITIGTHGAFKAAGKTYEQFLLAKEAVDNECRKLQQLQRAEVEDPLPIG